MGLKIRNHKPLIQRDKPNCNNRTCAYGRRVSFNWAMASGDAKSQNPNLLRTRTFCSELFSRQTHTPIDWKFHCASFGVWVCRVENPVKENMEVRKFYREIFWYTGSQSK